MFNRCPVFRTPPMLRGLFLLFVTLCTPLAAHADYTVSEVELARTATSIVDATVVGFTPKGGAKLKIHAHWVGNAAPLVKWIRYTCATDTPQRAGMQINQRYVILLDDRGNLFENSTFYRVKDGQVEGKLMRSDREPRTWMPLETFRAALLGLRTVSK